MTNHRLGAVAVAVAATLVSPAAAASPQVTDPANDANASAYWARDHDTQTPAGSQQYADVTSIQFATTKAMRKVGGRRVSVVTGFTVALRLTAPPEPPSGTAAVYRVMAEGPGCVFGIDYYTAPPAGQPAAAVQDWCRPPAIRRTGLAAPVVSGATITWTVPLSAVPRTARVAQGSTLTSLHFETLVRYEPACAGDAGTPAEEQPPCAAVLDGTFRRTGTYTIR